MSPRAKEIIYRRKSVRLTRRELRDGSVTVEAISPTLFAVHRGEDVRNVQLPDPHPGSPGYRSDVPILTLAYALAMRDVWADRTPEGLLKAGAAWDTVWTRDIAYAADLGADLAAPEETRASLRSRVRDGIILQDTGTGGGWPISTDRVSWALGAWACYLSGGGRDWLNFCIETLQKTLAQDARVLGEEGLVRGEMTFLDWREQSYPGGMSPAQIGASYSFSTNVLHCICRRILGKMLTEAGREGEAAPYMQRADALAELINENFYMRRPAHYAMLRLPDGSIDTRGDTLGTALAVLGGLAGKHAVKVLDKLPRSVYGTPVMAPYKPGDVGPYHNHAIWPFVEAYVLLAYAAQRDTRGVEFSLVSMLRAALVNGSNKENFNSLTGSADETLQNSDNQLWSAAGMLGAFYHGLLGLGFERECLVFAPCVPKSMAGSHWFTDLRIRDMILDVHLNGYGTEVGSSLVNGNAGCAIIPLDTRGHVQVELELLPEEGETVACTAQEETTRGIYPKACDSLKEPVWDNPTPQLLRWHSVPGATKYRVFINGRGQEPVRKTTYFTNADARTFYRSYRVEAIGAAGNSGPSEAIEYIAQGARRLLQPQRVGEHAEFDVQKQQAWLDTRPCTRELLYEAVDLSCSGLYGVRILYSNATASLRDADTCALRELSVDGQVIGIIPLPHNTEAGRWDDYALTAPVRVRLGPGQHTFRLCYTPDCVNGNGSVNQCMVRYLELVRLR